MDAAPQEKLHAFKLRHKFFVGIDRFFAKIFAGDYEASLIAEFEKLLPEKPPWKN